MELAGRFTSVVPEEVSPRQGPGLGAEADVGRRRGLSAEAIERTLRSRLAPTDARAAFFGSNSRSFRFAARFFRGADAGRVAGVYAYCRVTDDLVDRLPEGLDGDALLDAWRELSRAAHGGRISGHGLLDDTLAEMGGRGIPFGYVEELIEGMRMDLRAVRYDSMDALGLYTYRVAGVVGLWLARLFGLTDPVTLEHAARLGHAMQMTNILRDVGEDLARGRLYLPADRMEAHRVSIGQLEHMRAGGRIPLGYRALLEELMEGAEADYASALRVLPSLDPGFARPVAVAAYLYRGIHAEIRRNRYDNLRRRAHTGAVAKGILAARALWELHRGHDAPIGSLTHAPAR